MLWSQALLTFLLCLWRTAAAENDDDDEKYKRPPSSYGSMKSDSESMDDDEEEEEGEKKRDVESEKPVFVLPDPPAPAVVEYVSPILCCPDLFLCIFHISAGLTFASFCIPCTQVCALFVEKPNQI